MSLPMLLGSFDARRKPSLPLNSVNHEFEYDQFIRTVKCAKRPESASRTYTYAAFEIKEKAKDLF
jgi:hypothetical protein